MPIPKAVLKALDAAGVTYAVIGHKRVFTALDKASTLHEDPGTIVKVAVFAAGKKHALVLVPSSRHIDKAKVKAALNALLVKAGEKPEAKVDFATEQWMRTNVPGDVGATPLTPMLLGLPVLADRSLTKPPKLVVNIGSYEASALVNRANFMKLIGQDAVVGAFASPGIVSKGPKKASKKTAKKTAHRPGTKKKGAKKSVSRKTVKTRRRR